VKIFITFLLLCLTLVALRAQMPEFRLHPVKELGEVRMTITFQDSQGWMWCGAAGSLFRYDGLLFQQVLLPDSLANTHVTALFESKGRIWAGFSNGCIGYVPTTGNFPSILNGNSAEQMAQSTALQIWQPEEGLPSQKITAIAEDASGACWFGTYGEGLYVWKEGRLYQFSAADDGLSSDDIYALSADAQGRIWAATDAGISICSMPEKGQKKVLRLGAAEGLPDEIITALFPDNQGNMWIGTHDNGICCYDMNTRSCQSYASNWPYGPVTSLVVFGSTEVWAGTERNGPVRFEPATGKSYAMPDTHPLRHVHIRNVRKDREGLLWAVLDKGTLYSAQVKFSSLTPPFGNTQAVLVDSRGRLWAGSQNGLFLKENGVFKQVLPQPQNIISLWESPSSEIWAGSFGEGVFVLHAEGRLLRRLQEKDGLANGSVLSIAGTGQRIWLATLGGISVFDTHKQLFLNDVPEKSALGSSYIYKVFADRKGRIWFGTDGDGLRVLEQGKIRSYTSANGVPTKTIYSITEDKKGKIWFSTDKDGLFCLDGERFQHFTTANHLHSNKISGLDVSGDGNIVIGYDDGFDLLNPERVDHIVFCEMETTTAEVNLNALCRDRAGNVWLGAREGIFRIADYDEKFLDDPQPGITAVSVLMQTIDLQASNTFSYDQNYFIFNFTGLWYTRPESVRYRYKLEGFDPDWKISKDHLASYPNLPPGRYTFRVQTSEHGNFDQVPETSWSFTIQQPFWTQWWFVVLAIILTGLFFYGFVKIRETRLQREAQLKRENVESQFAALKSQINPHFLFNSFNTLITIIEENPKVAVEYVEHLSDFYRSMMAYRERDFITLQEEKELVESFYFLLKKRFEDGFYLENRLNGQAGLIMPLALQMLVENAVKHNVISASKPLVVEIFMDDDQYVVVRNNIQKKIKPETSTHFGLQSLIHRYRLLGERPVIVEDNVAFFTVRVPLKKAGGE
jgi:ligand-binding sensor domain-containing protein